MPVGSGGDSKHGDKRFDRILGIGITDLLMNLMSCSGFLKNMDSFVILKLTQKYVGILFLNRIYYFGMHL